MLLLGFTGDPPHPPPCSSHACPDTAFNQFHLRSSGVGPPGARGVVQQVELHADGADRKPLVVPHDLAHVVPQPRVVLGLQHVSKGAEELLRPRICGGTKGNAVVLGERRAELVPLPQCVCRVSQRVKSVCAKDVAVGAALKCSTPPRASFEQGGGGGGGGFGPKTWCTKNGLTRFSRLYISFFPTMVTLVWGGGEGVLGEGSRPLWFLMILKKPCPPPLCKSYAKVPN